MTQFKVIAIIDGETIVVTPNWKWNDQEGDKIHIYGYKVPKQVMESAFAKSKLEKLLLNEFIELGDPKNVSNSVLTSRVFRNSIDVSRYFPEFANF